jgi:rhamnulokinase
MPTTYSAAVDLGATSGRVIVGRFDGRQLELTEVHRFPNAYRELGPHTYWDLPGLWHEVRTGLVAARQRFPRLASVGVDTWGCDHVLTNDTGRVVFPTHAYRDARTQRAVNKLDRTRAALARLYTATGIPNVFYNTSLQLAETVASCPAVADLATRCLLLADYFNFLLSGRMENELTAASTTQLLDVQTRQWSREALDWFHLPAHWFAPPILAGTRLGPVRGIDSLAGVQTLAVPGHDTACAYAAMPAAPDGGDLFLSSGTWSLVGFESDRPVLGPAALAARIANERTADGHYRPLTNVPGLFLLEGTLQDFSARPKTAAEWARLIAAAEKQSAPGTLLDPTDPAFTTPRSMRAAIDAHLKKHRARPPRDLAAYVRLICESIGRGHAEAMRTFERMTGRSFRRILIVGGGSKNRLLCQATANHAGVPVVSFALEGTAVGNLASQFIALGAVKDLAAFRAALGRRLQQTTYSPR